VLFGPGVGVGGASQNNLRWLLRNLALPWVIDADGLNNLVLELDRLRHAKVPPVLTPHPGEMARLIKKSSAEVNADRVELARSFAVEHRCHLVLKGARTVIATADGRVAINPTGNPGMASAGMGDVLAGMLAALLGQGLAAEDAIKVGVYLHGLVGDRIAQAQGEVGLIASDVIAGLPEGLRELSISPQPPSR
jgi:ADP-dependent NAD(P)H-hydrate dehydratase / NAD(P)H-hydrate epimerase